jgi:hypothetical protein
MTKPFYEDLPLWLAIVDLPKDIAHNRQHRWQNLAFTAALAVVVSTMGLGVFRFLAPKTRPEIAGDFAENGGEATTDGRENPRTDSSL